MSPAHLVVLGSANADAYVRLARMPVPGETVIGADAATRPGGKGANQAAAAARLGCSTRFCGQVGQDAAADLLRRSLSEAGVDIAGLRRALAPTGQAMILLLDGGENAIVVAPGANALWKEPADEQLDAVHGAGALLLQREVPETVNHAAARRAHAAGVPVVLDAGGADDPIGDALVGYCHTLSPNESELARLTGMSTDDDDAVLAAARELQGRGVGDVLVKLGGRGCLLVCADGAVLRQPAYPVRVVDTTGAGDCFTAAYTVALIEGMAAADRLTFACAAAALCVQGMGALPSMPDRAAVLALLAGSP